MPATPGTPEDETEISMSTLQTLGYPARKRGVRMTLVNATVLALAFIDVVLVSQALSIS